MFLHLIIVAALLSNGTPHGRVAGSAVAFVYRISADAHASRLQAPSRMTRPPADRTPVTIARAAAQHDRTLTTQLRR